MELLIGSVLALLFTLVFVHALSRVLRTSKTNLGKHPPGPRPLPIVGNLFQLGDQPHRSLAKLAQVHGPLMTLKLGQITTIVFSSASLAKEVLLIHDPIFSNRCVNQAVRAHDHHDFSVAWLPVGAPWRNLRKICNSFIFSSQKLDANQDLRLKKIQQLVDDVQENCRAGKAIDIGQAAFRTTLNAMSSTVFSLDLADSNLDIARDFMQVVRRIMDEAGKPNLADYFPMLRKIDPQRIRLRMTNYFGKVLHLFDQLIDERVQARKEQSYIPSNDMLDILLTLDEENKEGTDRNIIKHLFLDLFVAGTDTTSSTLEWAMTELIRNPKTLSKARAEMEQTIGRGNMLKESDIARLPYLKAIIKETFRLHPAIPILLPRKAGADVEIQGLTIPKDAQLLVNAWAICRDPNLWENPDLFMPERFLESEIDARGQHFELIPFGGGRRICPGLPLAMRMLHLMLGSLILSFDWKLEDGIKPETWMIGLASPYRRLNLCELYLFRYKKTKACLVLNKFY